MPQDANDARPAEMVAGIGASAGGLDALERLFTRLSPDLPIAYVVAQHLSPDHKSMMVDLLSKRTTLAVSIGVVRGRNGANRVLRTDMGFESAAITSAPYTAARAAPCQAGPIRLTSPRGKAPLVESGGADTPDLSSRKSAARRVRRGRYA